MHRYWDASADPENHLVRVDGVETHEKPLPVGALIFKRQANGEGWYMWSSIVKVHRKHRMTAAAAAARIAVSKENALRNDLNHYQRESNE